MSLVPQKKRSLIRSTGLKLGHTFIDILKVDIEASEFDALTAFLDAYPNGEVLPVGQIQLEIHAGGDRGRFARFLHWWTALEAAGLRPFWTEPNLVAVNLYRGIRPEVAEVGCSVGILGRCE